MEGYTHIVLHPHLCLDGPYESRTKKNRTFPTVNQMCPKNSYNNVVVVILLIRAKTQFADTDTYSSENFHINVCIYAPRMIVCRPHNI